MTIVLQYLALFTLFNYNGSCLCYVMYNVLTSPIASPISLLLHLIVDTSCPKSQTHRYRLCFCFSLDLVVEALPVCCAPICTLIIHKIHLCVNIIVILLQNSQLYC